MTDKLTKELKQIGLGEVDVLRSSFVAIAYSRGWSKAKIGRYLGISRARVGQKIDKLLSYSRTGEYPTLLHLVTNIGKNSDDDSIPVGFEASDWKDIEFATALVEIVGNDTYLSSRGS